jgi:hypothetical protein
MQPEQEPPDKVPASPFKRLSVILHHIDPSLPRFDFIDGKWVVHDPKNPRLMEENPEYLLASSSPPP